MANKKKLTIKETGINLKEAKEKRVKKKRWAKK